MKNVLMFLSLLSAALLAPAVARSADKAYVDDNGVLRWNDGKEVAIMGVNYYAPFWEDYHLLKERGIDFRQTIDDDIQHWRRLGLDCLRLHAIDREISTVDGHLVANDHLDKLDYLLAAAISNGMHVVLTPIAWFSGPKDGEPKGFSQKYSKEQLCSEPEPERIVCRFLQEFVSHVNPYTGVRYADEPGILAFESFNEPRYLPGLTDEQLTAHVTRLAEAIRSTGTTKPIFYNVWQGRYEAIAAGKIDGITVSAYPNDIQHGYETGLPKLDRVRPMAVSTNAALAAKAKIAYEFDSADTCCSFMLPAIARMFRSAGVQAGAMFQYDELPLASENAATRTHYLSLVYTPGKAIGLAIAAEIFRRVPRGEPLQVSPDTMAFHDFRIDRSRDCAELAAPTRYYYTNGALTPPPDPERLKHVWGVGSSPVVSSEGTGAYFFDREKPGQWRLQVYPDVIRLADPFTGWKGKKVAAIDRPVTLHVNLPDLGKPFKLVLSPGDYVVTRGGKVSPAPADGRVPRFVLPPDLVKTPLVAVDLPRCLSSRRENVLTCPTAHADSAVVGFKNDVGEVRCFPVVDGVCRIPAGSLTSGRWKVRARAKRGHETLTRPTAEEEDLGWSVDVVSDSSDWNLFDAAKCANGWYLCNGQAWPLLGRDNGKATYRIWVAAMLSDYKSFTLRQPLTGAECLKMFPDMPQPSTLVVRIRARTPLTDRIEFVVYDAEERPWGKQIRVSQDWQEIRVATKDMMYFSHWQNAGVPPPPGAKLDARGLTKCAFTVGKWLSEEASAKAQEFEIESIRAE